MPIAILNGSGNGEESRYEAKKEANAVTTECKACGKEIARPTPVCPWCEKLLDNPEAGRLASPGQRLGASLLDAVLNVVVGIVLMIIGAGIGAASGSPDVSLATGLGAWILGSIALQCWFWSKGTSLGKNMLGMAVYRTNGTRAGFWVMAFRDVIGKIISGLVFDLGFLWLLWDPSRQCWHDKLAGTVVLKKS
ncbi:MAG: RDD family protein [Anaerolineae bacterium]